MLAFLRRYRVLLLHLSFWGCTSHFISTSSAGNTGGGPRWASLAGRLLGTALLAYFNYFVLLPRWLAHHRLGRYLLEFGAAFGLVVAVKVAVGRSFLWSGLPSAYRYSAAFVLATVLSTLFVVLFVAMLRFAVSWFALEARAKALENAQLATELQLLKAQINPHFLFNTLNNLYYLAYTQSPNTPEVVAQLAQMMRYLLEESNRPVVPLSQEIDYLRSYLSLEQLRLNHPVPITLVRGRRARGRRHCPAAADNAAGKRLQARGAQPRPTAWVRVQLRLTPGTCEYTVSNGRPPAVSAAPAASQGTGLRNLRRRLALGYPGRHTLRLDDAPDQYRAHLTLTLP